MSPLLENFSLSFFFFFFLRFYLLSWLVWLSGLSTGLQTKGWPVLFPVRAHAWVPGKGPRWGSTRSNHTLMFLSLSFSFPSL